MSVRCFLSSGAESCPRTENTATKKKPETQIQPFSFIIKKYLHKLKPWFRKDCIVRVPTESEKAEASLPRGLYTHLPKSKSDGIGRERHGISYIHDTHNRPASRLFHYSRLPVSAHRLCTSNTGPLSPLAHDKPIE